MADVRFLLTGDTSLCAEFGNEISEKINTEIRAFNILLNKSGIRGIVETVPTYRSLMIHYDPEIISYRALMSRLKGLTKQLDSAELPPSEVLEIPVLYGGEMGPDLDFVAEHAGISKEEVIKIHTSVPYLIYMLGFLPGFCYLGGLDERIHTPRLASPRIRIREGSVGIGGNATGIYPMDSPGGWQLMGMTPVKTFDPNREVPILLEAGQYIRFIPVSEDEFHEIRAQVEKGEYECVIHNEGSPDPGSGTGEGGE